LWTNEILAKEDLKMTEEKEKTVAAALEANIKAQDPDRKIADTAKEVETVILDLELSKVEALRVGGEIAAKWFERYFTDDVVYISGNGTLYTKAQTVDEFRSGFRKVHLVKHDDYHVYVYGGTAVLTYRGSSMGHNNKIPSNPQIVRSTDVYVKQGDGVWRIVVHHVTPVRT
jgi:ketosteroid isomerase-like protein